jgi:hypothetical protein
MVDGVNVIRAAFERLHPESPLLQSAKQSQRNSGLPGIAGRRGNQETGWMFGHSLNL